MNAPSPTTDIRVGDLVRFTNKQTPELTFTSRVRTWSDSKWYWSAGLNTTIHLPEWDFEVLDRPLPPIDEVLLEGALDAYFDGPRPRGLPGTVDPARVGMKRAINFTREYDRTHNKENA